MHSLATSYDLHVVKNIFLEALFKIQRLNL